MMGAGCMSSSISSVAAVCTSAGTRQESGKAAVRSGSSAKMSRSADSAAAADAGPSAGASSSLSEVSALLAFESHLFSSLEATTVAPLQPVALLSAELPGGYRQCRERGQLHRLDSLLPYRSSLSETLSIIMPSRHNGAGLSVCQLLPRPRRTWEHGGVAGAHSSRKYHGACCKDHVGRNAEVQLNAVSPEAAYGCEMGLDGPPCCPSAFAARKVQMYAMQLQIFESAREEGRGRQARHCNWRVELEEQLEEYEFQGTLLQVCFNNPVKQLIVV